MLLTTELLDLAKSRAGDVSDYRLAQLLGLKPSHISTYRNTAVRPSNPVAMRLAELCGLDAAQVIAWVNLERSSTDEDRQVWEFMLKRITPPKSRRLNA